MSFNPPYPAPIPITDTSAEGWVVILGEITEGVRVVGTFDTELDALGWAEWATGRVKGGASYEITQLHNCQMLRQQRDEIEDAWVASNPRAGI